MSDRERGSEELDHARNYAADLLKRWDDRLVLGRSDLLERYSAAKLHVYIRFRLGHTDDHIAIFQGAFALDGEHVDEGGVVVAESSTNYVDSDNGDRDQAVLIGVIEVLEHPQRVRVRGWSSMVGLKRSDELAGAVGNALYLSATAPAFVSLPRIENWKLVPTWQLVKNRFAAVQNDELMNEMVEGGLELINDFASSQDDSKGGRSNAPIHGDEVEPWISEIGYVFLTRDGVRVEGHKIGDLAFQLLDMGYGPI